MPIDLDLDTLKRIFEGLAIVKTITDRNSQDIKDLDARDKAYAERNADAIKDMELKKQEAQAEFKSMLTAARTELDAKIAAAVGESNRQCEERCQKTRGACPVMGKLDLLEQIERDKWFSSKIGKFWWTIGAMILGAVFSALAKELITGIFG